jgi:uncharacterized membrane protein
MQRPSGTRVRLWWERAAWVLPLCGILAGGLLVQLVEFVDEVTYIVEGRANTVSPEAATAVLAAIGGGMITFSGFVFSFAILIVQFGSSAYSPRMVSYFLRRRVTQWILALFLATITYSFVGLISIGSEGRAQFAPTLTVSVALLLLVLSLVGFVVLMATTGSQIRVDAVVASLGRHSRRQLSRRLPRQERAVAREIEVPAVAAESEVAAVLDHLVPVDYYGPSGQIVAIDVRGLSRLARDQGIVLEVNLRVGDAITGGTPIAHATGTTTRLERAVSRALVIDDERSIVHDPLYALRLLVDIAIRALSPAINDPTTAVRALDEIEGVLREAATRRLGTLRVDVAPGTLVLSTATWEEVVDLALLEIADSGRSQIQISRRLVALLDDLIPDVPEARRAALLRCRANLEAAAMEGAFTGRSREVALHGDRQGLGGSA